ncbi:unnamed protein product [Polarella glacialis]|uniref:Uncharacterized protein n=1 Tax=Polarella glacialis TaxID=89957 RepID=A0A813ETG0_POLGL|nr:unnamed protein product [Polarella glacialis]
MGQVLLSSAGPVGHFGLALVDYLFTPPWPTLVGHRELSRLRCGLLRLGHAASRLLMQNAGVDCSTCVFLAIAPSSSAFGSVVGFAVAVGSRERSFGWVCFGRKGVFPPGKPFAEHEAEFKVSGDSSEIVTKLRDFKERDWVVPVGGTLRLVKGGIYRWTLCIERKCPYRPQLHLGVHGAGHRRPWRLLTTTRCSRARDEEPWQDRPGGDLSIEEGDYVHIEVDLRGLHLPFGTMSLAINSEPEEVVFNDIPLNHSSPMMPVICMGGDQSRVRLCPAY